MNSVQPGRFAQGNVDRVSEDRVDMQNVAFPNAAPQSPGETRGVSHSVGPMDSHPFHGDGVMEFDRLLAAPRTLIRGQDCDLVPSVGLMAHERLHHGRGAAAFLR
jgi:hypothetical protein